MRRIVCCLLIAGSLIVKSFAQNVGIGTTEPYNKLHIAGNLLVSTPTTATTTVPTAAQTKTLPGLGTISFLNTDSTGRLYDPGGPTGNYGIDLDSKANMPSSSNLAIEVVAETMDLNTGDSLIIKESATGAILLAVGNVYISTGKWVFNSPSLYINFKSNTDFNIGAGFSLLFRRLYNNSSSLPDIGGITGKALFFDTKKGAFRSGDINNDVIGMYSTAMGYQNTASADLSTAIGFLSTASGYLSTAIGTNTTASGSYSIAMGSATTASGFASTAMNNSTTASGFASTAMGSHNTASGDFSTAIGYQVTASGDYSRGMGNYVNTNNYEGSFLIGDNSTTTVMLATTPNNFRARFAGGYRFYTSSDYSTSCALSPGANAWSTTSDMRLKENFETIDGEDFLKKIATMQLVSWNYKKQNPSRFRHYGPMAQEFYAAFGKDKFGNIGNDTTINQADFDGVNLIAIQALEKRTQKIEQIEEMNKDLKKENSELKEMILLLRKEMDELKKQFLKK